MKIIDPGHVFDLDWLDGKPREGWEFPENRLTFVKREGRNYPGNRGQHPGTNIQEVLRALISRVKYLDNQIPSRHNAAVLHHLRLAILNLEQRAAFRHGRDFPMIDDEVIEIHPTCKLCGHIDCHMRCQDHRR